MKEPCRSCVGFQIRAKRFSLEEVGPCSEGQQWSVIPDQSCGGRWLSSSLPVSVSSMFSMPNRLEIETPLVFCISAPIGFGTYVVCGGSGVSHSSGKNPILQPLYAARLIIQVRAKSAWWTEFVET